MLEEHVEVRFLLRDLGAVEQVALPALARPSKRSGFYLETDLPYSFGTGVAAMKFQVIQHRCAPYADPTMENTVEGARLVLQGGVADGLELDVSWTNGRWLAGHEAGRGTPLTEWLDAVASDLRAKDRYLLLDVKGPVTREAALELGAMLQQYGLAECCRAATFDEAHQLRELVAAGLPAAVFVHRQGSRGRLSVRQAQQAVVQLADSIGRLELALIVRWHRGPLTEEELQALCSFCEQWSAATGNSIGLWFSGLGKPQGLDERLSMIARCIDASQGTLWCIADDAEGLKRRFG